MRARPCAALSIMRGHYLNGSVRRNSRARWYRAHLLRLPPMNTESGNGNAPRIIVRIELTPSAKQQLVAIARRKGMTQLSIASRILEWFATQDVMIQGAI